MTLSVKYSVMTAAVLLMACSKPDAQPAGHCNGGDCEATVAVQSCEGGAMTVNPEPIPASRPNNISWTLSTPGYSFASNGIVINGSGFGHTTGSGKKVMVHNDHTQMGSIKYTVNVVRDSDNKACAPLDPHIVNQ